MFTDIYTDVRFTETLPNNDKLWVLGKATRMTYLNNRINMLLRNLEHLWLSVTVKEIE